MNDEWTDVSDKLPEEKTWVEVKWKPILPNIIEWFYCTTGMCPDRWPNGEITHWRYITHEIFSPIVEVGYVLELPILAK